MVPHDLKKKVLHINHHTLLAGRPGGKKLYHLIRKDYYWPSLTVDCYNTVRLYPHCACNHIKLTRNGELKLFPAIASLESVCLDILSELIRTKRGNRYLLVIVDRFTKMVRTIPIKTITAADVAKHFVHDWVFHYGPPVDLIADNGKQFDASYDRGQPISFGLSQVIPGWTEGMQLIGEGGAVILVIPSDLGYGDRGSPPTIPGGATLVSGLKGTSRAEQSNSNSILESSLASGYDQGSICSSPLWVISR